MRTAIGRRESGTMNRREALTRIGTGAAGLLCFAGARPAAGGRGGDLGRLADRLCAARGPEAFDAAAEAIRSGADHGAMLGAIFLCGVRDIRPRPHGILHTVMMVESSFRLAGSAPPGEEWLPVLFNLDDLKAAQESDRIDDGDWKLGPRSTSRVSTPEGARRDFVAAMEAWDPERADRAITALLPYHDRASLNEILWPLTVRCYAFIGHKIIYASQIERALSRIGWEHAEPALRSLARTVLVNRDTAAYERSRELARAIPDRWLQGTEDSEQSLQLLREIAARRPRQAQELVVDAFKDGLGPNTVWDALRLLGSEIVLKRPGRSASAGRTALLPVHALTVTHALGHAYRSTKTDATKRLAILQAAGWLPALRDDLASLVGLSMAGPGIETLGDSVEESAPALAEVIDGASPAQARTWLDREPSKRPLYLAQLRSRVSRRGQEHHQHKYAAAVEEESRLAHPRWASRILAPAVDYLANPADTETEVYRRSLRALQKAGIRL